MEEPRIEPYGTGCKVKARFDWQSNQLANARRREIAAREGSYRARIANCVTIEQALESLHNCDLIEAAAVINARFNLGPSELAKYLGW